MNRYRRRGPQPALLQRLRLVRPEAFTAGCTPAQAVAVDPDGWLRLVAGRRYLRTVAPGGAVRLEHERYHVGKALAGQRVAVAVDVGERAVVVRRGTAVLKRLPLRGLRGEQLPFERYVEVMGQEARARARRRAAAARRAT